MTTSLIPFGTRFPNIFGDFRREMDSLMERFLSGENGSEGGGGSWFAPSVNVAETESEFEITVDLPGLKASDVDVELRHGDLWISGKRKEEKEEKGKTWHRVERRSGEFRRMIHLGGEVDAEHVIAEYKDGVLRITVPKTETVRAKRIEVKG